MEKSYSADSANSATHTNAIYFITLIIVMLYNPFKSVSDFAEYV